MRDDSAVILSQCFPQEVLMSGPEMVFDVVHSALSLQSTALPSLQGTLKDGCREPVVAFDMPEPCKFLFLDSYQKGFLWTYKEVDLALHPVSHSVVLCSK